MAITPTGAPRGFRSARVFSLNSDGRINATSTTVYEGIKFGGARTLEVPSLEPRFIDHAGDDGVWATGTLPPSESLSVMLTTASYDAAMRALLTGEKSNDIGEGFQQLFQSPSAISNPNPVGLIGVQQMDSPTEGVLWFSAIFPSIRLLPVETSMGEDSPGARYSGKPQFVQKSISGVAFTVTDDGATRAQGYHFVTKYGLKVVAWKANGTADTFSFPTNSPAAQNSDNSIRVLRVTVNDVVTAVTASTTDIDFASAPAANAIIVCEYETSGTL